MPSRREISRRIPKRAYLSNLIFTAMESASRHMMHSYRKSAIADMLEKKRIRISTGKPKRGRPAGILLRSSRETGVPARGQSKTQGRTILERFWFWRVFLRNFQPPGDQWLGSIFKSAINKSLADVTYFGPILTSTIYGIGRRPFFSKTC